MDVLVESQPRGAVVELLEFAQSEGLQYSVRMADTPLDDDLQAYADAGIMDVFFAPEVFRPQVFEGICSTCAELGLPLRVQITRPHFDAEALREVASMLWAEPVRSINLAPYDPFLPEEACSRNEVNALLEQTAELARAAAEHGKEVNILRLPFCLMPRERWPEVLTENQMLLHHQQYISESYDLAKTLYRCSPSGMASGLEHQLSADATLYHVINKAAFSAHHRASAVACVALAQAQNHAKVGSGASEESALARAGGRV